MNKSEMNLNYNLYHRPKLRSQVSNRNINESMNSSKRSISIDKDSQDKLNNSKLEDKNKKMLNNLQNRDKKLKIITLTKTFMKIKPETPYIFIMGGPILISAPHTLPVDRILESGEYRSFHKREKYAAEVTTRISSELKSKIGNHASFIIWDPRTKYNSNNLDPNFLCQSNFKNSAFHKSIH